MLQQQTAANRKISAKPWPARCWQWLASRSPVNSNISMHCTNYCRAACCEHTGCLCQLMRPGRGPTPRQCTLKNAAWFSDYQPWTIIALRVWCRHRTSILWPDSHAQQCKQSCFIKHDCFMKCFMKPERHLYCAAGQSKPCEPGWYLWQTKQFCGGNSAKRGRNKIRGVISSSLHQTQTEPRFREKPNPPMWPCLVSFCFSECARTCCSLNTTC